MPDIDITLNLPGEHNVRNALAAIAVATELELPDAAVIKALAEFHGVGRRFQRWGDVPARDGGGAFTLIDDYGHHPVGDGGRDRGGARRLSAAPARHRIRAASLHAHARLLRGLRQGAWARPTWCC